MAELEVFDNNLVTTGSPADGGCCWTSFAEDTTLPTDATTAMATPWESLGDLTEDGFTEGKSITSSKLKGWRGSTVVVAYSDEDRTVKLAFIEVNRPSVAKLRYGAKNVTAGTDGSVAKIIDKVGVIQNLPFVIDELESGGFLRRTVIKRASVESFDDVPHQRGSLLVYGMTLSIIDTGDGEPVTIYRAKPSE